jgi:hypothetical protein
VEVVYQTAARAIKRQSRTRLQDRENQPDNFFRVVAQPSRDLIIAGCLSV